MRKAHQIKSKTWIIIPITIVVVLLVIILAVINRNSKYVGAYNYNNQNSIILKQDGTCDFTDHGESGYSNSELKCLYTIENDTVYLKRDVRRYFIEKEGYTQRGKGLGAKYTCVNFKGQGLMDYCKEEIVNI